jgi:hypothetical protein
LGQTINFDKTALSSDEFSYMKEVVEGLKSKIDALNMHTKVLKKEIKQKDV